MGNKQPGISSSYVIYGALGLGLATAIAVRALLVLSHIQPSWVRPVWYFAVLGNFIFFLYRYHITEKRKKAVNNHQLIEKISRQQPLSADDRVVLGYLLTSIRKSPEHINYLIIFLFSILAIAMDLTIIHFW